MVGVSIRRIMAPFLHPCYFKLKGPRKHKPQRSFYATWMALDVITLADCHRLSYRFAVYHHTLASVELVRKSSDGTNLNAADVREGLCSHTDVNLLDQDSPPAFVARHRIRTSLRAGSSHCPKYRG